MLRLQLPCLIDGLDNAVGNAYLAWPVRIAVIDAVGKIAVLSDRNPNGFGPALGDVSQWLAKLVL